MYYKQNNIKQLVQELCRDYTVFHAHSRDGAKKRLQKDIAVVIADHHVLGRSGQDVMNTIALSPESIWILFGDQSISKTFINQAFQDGTLYHYITQPWQPEEVYNLVKRSLEHKQAIEELQRLKAGTRPPQTEVLQASPKTKNAEENRQIGIVRSDNRSETNYQEFRETFKKFAQTEKMAALGQMIAEVSHEINTPSGAINAAVVNLSHYLKLLLESFWEFDQLEVKREHLRQIIRIVEKMLTALDEKPRRTPAEVRAEQKDIMGKLQQQHIENSRKISKDIARMGLTESLDELLSLSSFYDIDAIFSFFNKCSRIINSAKDIKLSIDFLTRFALALKSYSYPWQDNHPALADIHESIDTVLIILNNKLKHQIQVDFRQGDVPNIVCYSNELSHVWLNIIHNAIQALKGKGKITIETFLSGQHVGVKITDTGPGIAKNVQPRIFDVNFTTKSQGKGTGLGLYIAHQVIQKHGGSISVDSVPGRTTFEVHLPLCINSTSDDS